MGLPSAQSGALRSYLELWPKLAREPSVASVVDPSAESSSAEENVLGV